MGQQFDEETGLHYNNQRDYDPITGRYLQSDPIGLKGGVNAYAYTASNPLKYVDPRGEAFWIPFFVGIGFFAGDVALQPEVPFDSGVAQRISTPFDPGVLAGTAQKACKMGMNVKNEASHFKGTEKAWADGATPNSTYTQVHPNMQDKAIQNSIYNSEGKIIGQVDFKPQHGAPSGHGHMMKEAGNIGSGHQGAATYISPENLPSGWNNLPEGVVPIKP
jgi:RHS repeat-associated protein